MENFENFNKFHTVDNTATHGQIMSNDHILNLIELIIGYRPKWEIEDAIKLTKLFIRDDSCVLKFSFDDTGKWRVSFKGFFYDHEKHPEKWISGDQVVSSDLVATIFISFLWAYGKVKPIDSKACLMPSNFELT